MAVCHICQMVWRRRRNVLRCICTLVVVFVIIVVIVIRSAIDEGRCDDNEMRDMLRTVCKSYRAGYVVGSMCHPLCEQNEVHYTKCLNHKEGKKIIFANWDDKSVILKAKNKKPKEREILGFSYEDSQVRVPTIDYFMNMVRDNVFQEFGIRDKKTDEDLLYSLWTGTESVSSILLRGDISSAESLRQESIMRSLWSLVQQSEYLFLQYFSDKPHLPLIFGSCGHVYAMEYAPSTAVLDPDILQISGISQFSWHERVKVAIDLLNVLKSIEEDFHEPLHLCDVKGSNFGISQDGQVKPIDTDTVFFHSKLEEIMAGTDCTSNQQCDFFDCLGQCNLATQKCYHKIVNNNLEAVCRKILASSLENVYVGLLSNPPSEIKTRLDDVLEECLQLKDQRLEHSQIVFSNLYELLQESNQFS